jgi:DNA-binding Lrp family transcriptional regulator
MRPLDDTDREILRLLLADGRRPYSDIADRVDLSAPAVSDRIDRLREHGVVRSFTVDVDRSLLSEGTAVLVDLAVDPGRAEAVAASVSSLAPVEHLFRTADSRVVFEATLPGGDVDALLAEAVDADDVRSVEVSLVAEREWSPGVGDAALAPPCAECGNTVDAEGVASDVGGTLRHFCCDSCLENYRERYERLETGV